MRIKHLTLNVTDLERSIEFYTSLTGCRVLRRLASGPATLAFLADEEGQTELELLSFPGRRFEGKGLFLCYDCPEDQLEERHAFAVEQGWGPSDIQDPGDGTRYFYVYDPDKMSVQLRTFPQA